MNMGDELYGAAVQVSTKMVESGVHIITDVISKLIQMIQAEQKNRNSGGLNGSDKDITNIRPGKTSIRNLIKNARESGDTINASESGLSDADAKTMEKLSKKYGIPVAFISTNGGEPHYPCFMSRDLPVFRMMCTEMMRNKMETIPQTLGNFKCDEWQIPFITAELNRYELNAQFGYLKSGESFCMYDKQDEKAILIARSEFLKKHKEISNEILFDKSEPDDSIMDMDEKGIYTIKNIKTGKEISFDNSMNYDEVSKLIQKEFGFDENKANMCTSKFGSEMLNDEDKRAFFSKTTIDEFKSIKTNIKFKEDDAYCKSYRCMRVVPKDDEVSRIVFSDESGNFAAIENKMSRTEKENVLRTHLGITDKKEMESIIAKSDRAFLYYEQQYGKLYNTDIKFDKAHFNMSDVKTVSGMKRESEGHIYTRSLPLDELNLRIDRIDKDHFRVKSNAVHIETNENNEKSRSTESRIKVCSFSDKKKALHELEQFLVSQGVPQTMAKRAAHEAFNKSKAQDAERIVAVEDVKIGTETYSNVAEASVVTAGKHIDVDLINAEKGKKQIMDALDIQETEASEIYQKASRQASDKQAAILSKNGIDYTGWNQSEIWYGVGLCSEHKNWTPPEGTVTIEKIREELNILKEKTSEKGIDLDDLSNSERWYTRCEIKNNGWEVPEGMNTDSIKSDFMKAGGLKFDNVKKSADNISEGISNAIDDADDIISRGGR